MLLNLKELHSLIHAQNEELMRLDCVITGWEEWGGLKKSRRIKDITRRAETPRCKLGLVSWKAGGVDVKQEKSATWQHANTRQHTGRGVHAWRTWEEIQSVRWEEWGYSLRCAVAELPGDETCYAHAGKPPSPRSLGLFRERDDWPVSLWV